MKLPAIIAAIIILLPSAAVSGSRLSLTNLLVSAEDSASGERITHDENRIRWDASVFKGDTELKLIVDDEMVIGADYLDSADYQARSDRRPDLPFDSSAEAGTGEDAENRLKLYRAYLRLSRGKTEFTAGLFRIGLGVGKLWTPVDIFNPKDPLALEPEEYEGTAGAWVKQFIGGFSSIEAAGAFDREKRLSKGLVRVKRVIGQAEAGVLALRIPELSVLGWELTGTLGETGIELRTEGGWFADEARDDDYFRLMTGAEYGFSGGLTIALEYLHNGAPTDAFAADPAEFAQTGEDYLGAVLSYQLTPLIVPSVSHIQSLTDAGSATAPSLTISITDETEGTLGAQIFSGASGSEYGGRGTLYFAKLTHFF